MPDNNPFNGMRLSEQSGPAKLDQRLFESGPTPKAPPLKPTEPARTEEAKKPSDSSTATATRIISPATRPLLTAAPRFDVDEEPLYKASYLFTQEELEALEDLKLELRREYDTKVTKNELIRSALHLLMEDHTANKGRSYASRKVGKRETR